MNLAVISDIHANREALDSVLQSLEDRSIDRIICLGDIVNYGVDFDYCVEKVKEIAAVCVMGNHDSTVVQKDPLWHMNREAQKSALWTMERLSPDHRSYLERLPLTHSENDMLFVHSAPGAPGRWDYITNWFDAEVQFDNFSERLCFVGHSHIPGVYGQSEGRTRCREGMAGLDPELKFIINVGSVGQPRDQDPRASFAVVEAEANRVEIVRVTYDVQKASGKIAAAGVSSFHARRILVGV
ncbi:MAG: metallophosphoesterase family protein [Fidelibacterota bacterium]